jgi:tRNA/tmRNA/rRNA uracil-C5-methylase (TrmA/RlmC/RlmD family)
VEPDRIVREFTHQSESFNAAPVMRSAGTLGRLLDLIPAAPGERWLDAACGPGLVARGLAPRTGRVDGVDMTPAMVDLAGREAAREGVGNAVFAVGEPRSGSRRRASTAPSPASACTTSPSRAALSPSCAGSCGPAGRSSSPTT